MDAVGIVLMGAGAFLAYSAVKGIHPWTAFLSVLKATTAATGGTVAKPAPNGQPAITPQPTFFGLG
jgi:hypothetical protein